MLRIPGDQPRTKPAAGGQASLKEGGPLAGGSYLLLVHLEAKTRLRIGALGDHNLARGWYVYAGSARRHLAARVSRHFARRKRVHWHIDHVTTARRARPVEALLVFGEDAHECLLLRLAEAAGCTAPVPRFGAGDCRHGCPAHLGYSPTPPVLQELPWPGWSWRILLPSDQGGCRARSPGGRRRKRSADG